MPALVLSGAAASDCSAKIHANAATAALPAVHILPVSNLDDVHGQTFVFNCVKDAVIALSEAELVGCAGKLFSARWSRIFPECSNSADDSLSIFSGYGLELFCRRLLDSDAITCHVASENEQRSRNRSTVHAGAPRMPRGHRHPRRGFAAKHRSRFPRCSCPTLPLSCERRGGRQIRSKQSRV